MLTFLFKRIIQMAVLFVIFLTVLFFLLNSQPGDISQQFLNPNIPAQARQQIVADLGLNQPVYIQYRNYIENFFTGNLGFSFQHYPRPVIDVITERIPRTLVLFATATMTAYWMGFVLGKILAWKRGKASEYAITVSGVLLYTVFYPWFAILMIITFAVTFKVLPVNQFLTPEKWVGSPFSGNEVFTHMILSTLALSIVVFVGIIVARRFNEHAQRKQARRAIHALGVIGFIAFWVTNDRVNFALDITLHMVLPVVTLSLVAFAGVMLLTRSSMLETLREDYILTARAKGLSEKMIRDRHAARNALLPLVTSFVIGLAFIIGGGIITETVFSWPGMGQLLLDATLAEDIPVAIGVLSFIGLLALIAHIVVDVLYMFLDPRIRYQ